MWKFALMVIFIYDSFQVRNKNASMSGEKMVVVAGLGTTKSLSDLISELTSKGKVTPLLE